MKPQTLPLCGPPGFEYVSTGPYFVCHMNHEEAPKAWVMWTLDSAIQRFWASNDPYPVRRVMVDALGVTVLGTDGTVEGETQMCGCRQVAEATLTLVRTSPATAGNLESEVSILQMIETLRINDGQAI